MAQMFGYLRGSERVSSACLCEKNGRLEVAKKEAPERANVRGFGHSTTAKQLEQHL